MFTNGFDVYIAGTSGINAAYWKNGKEVDLAQYADVTGIAVSGQDVYVCGELNRDTMQAVYWKNRAQVSLYKGGLSHVSGIAFSGADVYCSGTITDNGGFERAVYWRNGELFNLSPAAEGVADAITLSGNNMIVAGHIFQSFDTAVLWNNGVLFYPANTGGRFNDVMINGSDTYVAGIFGSEAVYWKNDSMIVLSQDAKASSITVSGSDVYIAGSFNNNGEKAAYWKNGELVSLTSPYPISYGADIAIAGTDIYVVGTVSDGYKQIPVYWKNGMMGQLGANGTITAISIGQ